ncbi:septal ring lytic transglycosylase RlpA family protein [Rubricoccus marinus]|uniref:septal ring lytic transglycosylase RlpA family protein n=1 Tax=Rubricoccus marinus TaxID=716817 RepID=UPI0015C5C0D8|nr:septal ring lytic transglycosylase RlpA family protein [Rubricoccus marinus]
MSDSHPPPSPQRSAFGRSARGLAAALVVAITSVGLWPQPSPAPVPPRVKKVKRLAAPKATRPLATPLPSAPEPIAAPAPVAPEVAQEAAPASGVEEGEVIGTGRASYYGQELAGNRTASGERFDPSELTAAHRTLPLGSRVRVTNERTGASVIVRVNDRGPFADDRVLDVSESAAREIGMIRRGTARVRMELLPRRRG